MDGVADRMPDKWVVSLIGGLFDVRSHCYKFSQIGGLTVGRTNSSVSSFRPPLCTPRRNQLVYAADWSSCLQRCC